MSNLEAYKKACTYEILGKTYFHPGYYICEYLEANNKTIISLGNELNISSADAYHLCGGEKYMSYPVIENLAKLTGTSIEYWQNIQDTYFNAVDCISLY